MAASLEMKRAALLDRRKAALTADETVLCSVATKAELMAAQTAVKTVRKMVER
mgnify:CR=1 FL=1